MPWVRLDDQMAFNAKVIAAGNIAIGARDRMLAWASAAKSGGTIPAAMAAVIVQSEPLLASMGVVLPPDIAQRTLAWMVTHRVLDEAPGGYRIHDAEDYGNTASVAVGQKRPMSEAEAKQRKLAAAKSVASRAAKRAAESTARSNGANEEPNGPFQRPVQKTNGPFQRSERPVETEPTGYNDRVARPSPFYSLT